MNYKVKSLSVGGLRKKAFESGDIVTDENFKPGRAKELVQQGFLVPVVDDTPEEKKTDLPPVVDDNQPVDNVSEKFDSDDNNAPEGDENYASAGGEKSDVEEGNKIPALDDITHTELKKKLTKLEIPFHKNSSKEELYDLWISAKEKK